MDYVDVKRESNKIAGRVYDINISPAFKGHNFMTREVLGYFARGKHQIELSMGSGFSSMWLFGVTVAVDDIRDFDKSTCFNDLTEAIEYMDSLN